MSVNYRITARLLSAPLIFFFLTQRWFAVESQREPLLCLCSTRLNPELFQIFFTFWHLCFSRACVWFQSQCKANQKQMHLLKVCNGFQLCKQHFSSLVSRWLSSQLGQFTILRKLLMFLWLFWSVFFLLISFYLFAVPIDCLAVQSGNTHHSRSNISI